MSLIPTTDGAGARAGACLRRRMYRPVNSPARAGRPATRRSWQGCGVLGFCSLLVLAILFFAGTRDASAAVCSLTVGSLDFGAVDSLTSSPVDSAASLEVGCDQVLGGSVTVCVQLGAGTGGASGGARRLASAVGDLAFQLYQDGGRSIPWGSATVSGLGTQRRLVLSASGERASALLTLYGRVFGGQTGAEAARYASSFAGSDVSIAAGEGDVDCDTLGGGSTAAFSVTAQVSANCLVEASDIAFGQHGLIDHDIDAEGTIGITCTPGTDYRVTLGGGLRNSADPAQRILQSGADLAVYGLYRDAARSLPWGSSLETQLPGTGAGARQTVSVYGRVPPQALPPGTYTDTVTVTLTYDDLD